MPISEKIIKEIEVLDEEEKVKELMRDILQLEDDGAKRWNKQYENKINDYLRVCEEDGKN